MLIFILGLALGSFVNAYDWRTSQLLSKSGGKKSLKNKQKYSVLSGRSMCVHCQHVLTWYDLMPVISWLSLKGHCRYCKKPISAQYPTVELLTATLFVISYAYWPLCSSIDKCQMLNDKWQLVTFGLWLLILTQLVALGLYDLKRMILPSKMLYTIYMFAVPYALVSAHLTNGSDSSFFLLPTPYFHLLLSTLAGGGFFWLLYQISKGKWIGGGDVRLGFLLGLIVGKPELIFLNIVLASFIGTLVSLPLLLSKKLKASSRLPFGPLLIIGCFIVVLFGKSILDWYLNSLLLIG
jgi:leader peptidase (prepilin peptidase) / N-methyltransferase